MSEDNKSDSYEVGYGKPPKNTQFRKGMSGNPKGRPRKASDFDDELLRESRSPITVNENGRRRRISKHSAVIKQVMNKAMSGYMPALRTYFSLHQMALEKKALLEASRPNDPAKHGDVDSFSDEELARIIREDLKTREKDTKNRHISKVD